MKTRDATRPGDIAVDEPLEACGDRAALLQANRRLRNEVKELSGKLKQRDEQRRAMLNIMGELNSSNKRLADQRKAMLHILGDYEDDRRGLALKKVRLDDSRRALLHILQDVHQTNTRLGNSRKAMIHIMGDLRETTEAIQHSERELREKQEQLVQAGKLATLGELTTGVAHELNNPLNNIGLFVGNVIDMIEMEVDDKEAMLRELRGTMQQVRKATEIISHLRTFGRAAHVTREPLEIREVIRCSLTLLQEQLRLRQIDVELDFGDDDRPLLVLGNAIRLEQVFINLLSNARDALADAPDKLIRISCFTADDGVNLSFEDTGCGISPEYEERIFDPFFTTKDVGAGTGLGLSITYGIISDHGGTISVGRREGAGTRFLIALPVVEADSYFAVARSD